MSRSLRCEIVLVWTWCFTQTMLGATCLSHLGFLPVRIVLIIALLPVPAAINAALTRPLCACCTMLLKRVREMFIAFGDAMP